MPEIFPLEPNLFFLNVVADYTPLQVRNRSTDGSIQVLDMAPRVLWSMVDIRCRIITSAEFQSFHDFFFDNRARAFIIRDPTLSNIFLEITGSGNGTSTAFTMVHTYVTVGTLEVFLDAVLQTETVDYTVNYTTGVITFASPPSNAVEITTTYRFRRLVLFDGGYTWEKRAICDGPIINNTQLGIIRFDVVESVNE